MLLIVDIVQVTFVTLSVVELPTASFISQAMDMQAKTSNVTKHMPTRQ